MAGEWVLLSYRLPREPSAPRVAVWRRLKRLGVAQISDGLVALPADARTREQVEWAAEDVVERGGAASVWLARPATDAQERSLATAMAAGRAEEYRDLESAVRRALSGDADERRRALIGLRRRNREISRRDFFPPPERDLAAAALRELADGVDRDGSSRSSGSSVRPGRAGRKSPADGGAR